MIPQAREELVYDIKYYCESTLVKHALFGWKL